MMKNGILVLSILTLVAGAVACGSSSGGNGGAGGKGGSGGATSFTIGSPCTKDSECGGTDFMCMTDHPDGYCIKMCDHTKGDADCPAGSICQWDGQAGECHKNCDGNTDCRTGYECAPASTDPNNTASHAFCDVAEATDAGTD